MQLNVHNTLIPITNERSQSIVLTIIGSTWLALNGPLLSVESSLCLFALLSGGLSTSLESLPTAEATRSKAMWMSLNMSAIATLWVLLIMTNG